MLIALTRLFYMKKIITGHFKAFDEDSGLITFVASTNVEDREGEVIDPNGWILDGVGKNLPLLWSHNAYELPIGKVVEARVENNNLVTVVEFAYKVNEFAKKVYDLVKAGFLNAVSVGFLPRAYDAQGNMISQELLELSVVNVPANQEALRSEVYQSFIKSLDKIEKKEKETKSPACRMTDESEDECVARKIPEIKKENPDMKQEQCVAIAENVCKKSCEEKEKNIKEGRIISEKNRNTMRIAIDSMKQASDHLVDLLNATEPPDKKGGVNNESVKKPLASKAKRILKSVQLMDKIGEAIIHEIKEGGEIK